MLFFSGVPFLIPLALVFFFSLVASSADRKDAFPNVDLGYAVHAVTHVNTTSSGLNLGNYNNIRFAQKPVGGLRFRKPETPPPHQSGIQDGIMDLSPDCVSSASSSLPFPDINGTHWGTEDCLFLNVRVPEGVNPGDNVPVIHWIHGSGYAFGSKDLFEVSLDSIGVFDGIKDPKGNFIFVASNYRLGLYGWASSPYEDMEANVGLHDSIAAVEWTKKYISRFGGDPDSITVFGQSAGAAAINLMLTGNGGEGDLPFSKAILASPGLMPRRNVAARRQFVYEQVLKSTGCSTLNCLREFPDSKLAAVNNHLISEASAGGGGGTFGPGIGFGPVVDGKYVLDTPQVLLQRGRFHTEVESVIAANTANEGEGLSPDEKMPENFPKTVRKILPGANDTTVQRIQDLFPVKEGEPPEKMAWDWLTSILFACNARSVAKAYAKYGRGRRYITTAAPAAHTLDLFYLLHINQELTPVSDLEAALQMQSYIRSFISSKSPSDLRSQGLPEWPLYGSEANTLNIKEKGLEITSDPWETSGTCKALLEIIEDEENGA